MSETDFVSENEKYVSRLPNTTISWFHGSLRGRHTTVVVSIWQVISPGLVPASTKAAGGPHCLGETKENRPIPHKVLSADKVPRICTLRSDVGLCESTVVWVVPLGLSPSGGTANPPH